MIPVPLRVLFPAAVSLISALWALAEWRSHRGDAATLPDDENWRDEMERRQVAREQLAERKQRLAEAREARLAAREAAGATSRHGE